VSRAKIEKIIREEFVRRVDELMSEAAPEVADAHDDEKEKEVAGKKDAQQPQGSPDNGASPKSKKSASPAPDDAQQDDPNVQPDEQDPADDELEKDSEEGDDDVEDQEKDAKKKLSDLLVGKSVQSITQEPKSKVLPGAQEIVLTFDNTPDPLRILVTKTGVVKFLFRNQLHNEI
jgi:hypothetical protein